MMAEAQLKWWALRLAGVVLMGCLVMFPLVAAETSASQDQVLARSNTEQFGSARKPFNYSELKGTSHYHHEWPELKFGWKIAVGTIIGFLGAAFGSVGGVGGGGIFVPMLALIIGFDPKSSTALSKCMITGTAVATVCYNIRQRHPTLEEPLIDYDLALLFQPMLVLGISLGVGFNVIFADWMITILLIILFLGMSTKSFLKGIETWKKETMKLKEEAKQREANFDGDKQVEVAIPTEGQGNITQAEGNGAKKLRVSLLKNIKWKDMGILVAVWVAVLALQIAKNYSRTCSAEYWALNLAQAPITVGVTSYEAVSLYKGRRRIASKGEVGTKLKPYKLVIYCAFGILAGIVGGMLGLGGGFILGPLFLEMGVPPQVSSATATFVMTFSASMSVVEYYLLKRFPVPYALYLVAVSTVAAFAGQYLVGKVIKVLGRASLIIFILAGMIFASAISLGGVGIANMIERLERKQYMGFEDICSYHP